MHFMTEGRGIVTQHVRITMKNKKDPVAKSLRTPRFKIQIVGSIKAYDRKRRRNELRKMEF